MKILSLKKEFEKLLINKKKYYVEYNRNKKINYKNYYKNSIDPDGKIRNLIKEEKYKLSQLKIVLNFLKKTSTKKKKKILDFGCGYGWLLKNLNNTKWKKYGIEINNDARKIANKNKIECYKNLNNLRKENFDIITLIHVIEHIKKPKNLLKKIINKIKKNGYLILETPDFDSAMARRYNNKFRLLHDKTHVSLFSTQSISRLIENLGMKIIKIEYPYFEGPFFNRKNILKLFSKKKNNYSPPFYGSVVTIFAKKK